MRLSWCRKRTSLFVFTCAVFLGGNIILLSSLSWPFYTFSSSTTSVKRVGISTFEKIMKDDLLKSAESNEPHIVITSDTVKHGENNDVELSETVRTLAPNHAQTEPSKTLLGNRGDLENKMFKQADPDSVPTTYHSKMAEKETEDDAPLDPKSPLPQEYTIPVLVISCNRPAAVSRSLDQLLKYRPSVRTFPVIVSQDCGDESTAQVIKEYGDKIIHIKQPDLSNIPVQPPMARYQGYYKIARHYKWALTQIFEVMKYESVIIVEDDLDIAPDFFEYFKSTRPLLDQDPTIWCVSAWNDNGKKGYVQGQDILYRSDFFPGLGWMLTKKLWNELGPKWPKGFWDDWMREPEQRQNRACIRPEVSRTKTFGKIGVSNGQFYDYYLRLIHLNDKPYPFSKTDLSYLHKSNFDKHFLVKVYKSPVIDVDRLQSGQLASGSWLLNYTDKKQFARIAQFLGIMDDFKAGVPRTGYMGVVSTLYKGSRIYIAPPWGTFTGYTP